MTLVYFGRKEEAMDQQSVEENYGRKPLATSFIIDNCVM